MYPEGMYEAHPRPMAYPQATRGLTEAEACTQARTQLCALDARWCQADCASIKANVCGEPTLFVGAGGAPIRCAFGCPNPDQVSLCEGGGGEGDATPLILAFAGLAVIGGLAIAIARGGKKKVIVARIQR